MSLISNRLKQLREDRELSQWELSQLSGIRPDQLSKYETGVLTPRLDKTARLAKALGVSIDALLSGSPTA